jgi:hypothetical protein
LQGLVLSQLYLSVVPGGGGNLTPTATTTPPLLDPSVEVVQTFSVASNSKIALAANTVVTPTVATNLKREGVIVEHSFSDGTKWRFRNITGHAVANNDIAIADTATLPQFINFLEKELEKRKKALSAQTITIDPNGCHAYFWWWCINPVSNYLWTTKIIPYQFDASVTPAQRTQVINSVASWNAKPGLTVKWKNVADYGGASTIDKPVTIKSVDAGASYCGQAFVGYQGRVVTTAVLWDFINLNNNPAYSCFDDRTIHHEMGHVLGLPHEQARCDRDQYITLSGSAVENASCSNVKTWNRGFDFASIMLYDSPGVTPLKNASGVYIGNSNYTGTPGWISNSQLSSVDIATINDLYQGR